MQGKVCGKKRHTKTEIRSEISELICGRIAAGENYNLTRDIPMPCLIPQIRCQLLLLISSSLIAVKFIHNPLSSSLTDIPAGVYITDRIIPTISIQVQAILIVGILLSKSSDYRIIVSGS